MKTTIWTGREVTMIEVGKTWTVDALLSNSTDDLLRWNREIKKLLKAYNETKLELGEHSYSLWKKRLANVIAALNQKRVAHGKRTVPTI